MFFLFASAYSSTPQPPSLSHVHRTFQRVTIAWICKDNPGWYFVRPVHYERAPRLHKAGWYVHLSDLHLVKSKPQTKRIGEIIPDYSTPLHFAPCLHRNVVVETTGSRTFAEGEVSDNIEEHVLCLECMRVLTEAEVRARWNEGWDVFVHQAVHSEI